MPSSRNCVRWPSPLGLRARTPAALSVRRPSAFYSSFWLIRAINLLIFDFGIHSKSYTRQYGKTIVPPEVSGRPSMAPG